MQYDEMLNELIEAITNIKEEMKKLAERLVEDLNIGGILEAMRLYANTMFHKRQRAPRSLYPHNLPIADKRAAIRRLQTVRNR